MRRALVAGAVVGCAACSAVAGLNKDYAVDDATSAATDAGESDALRTPERDAASPIDAGPDAPTVPFCLDGGALFCTDFETAPTVEAEWTRTESTGGRPVLVSAIGVGGTRALDAMMTATTSATAATVVWRTIATSFPVNTTITLTFSFNVKRKATSYAALGVIQVGGIEQGLAMYDPSKCLVGSDCLDENDQSGRGHDSSNSTPLALDTWYTGLVSVTRTATGFAGTVKVGDAVVDSRTTGALPANAASANPVTVEVGVGSFYSSGSGVNDVVFDNVKVTNQLP